MKKILICSPTYNESENITELCKRIFKIKKKVDLLIIDDNSPDGTSDIVKKIKKKNRNLILIKRKSKLGIGSAFRAGIKFAVENKYNILVTLDADLSHQPEEIPKLLLKLKENDFVIGSRYITGGKSNYTGYRSIISRTANIACRTLLNINLHEFTTSFRAYNYKCLKILHSLPVLSEGYSSFMETVFYISKNNLQYAEVPIVFKDRYKGKSKIPKLQIIYGGLKLIELFLKRLIIRN
mgnify:CR=1 FL=1|tara:strand:- start:26 stop:739 length:714 start_codon:yes stop_codon:yes gene_type:complete